MWVNNEESSCLLHSKFKIIFEKWCYYIEAFPNDDSVESKTIKHYELTNIHSENANNQTIQSKKKENSLE